jgi:hypothetical protein
VWNPNVVWTRVWLTVALSELNRKEAARAEAAEIIRTSPHFSFKGEGEQMSLRDRALEERHPDDLRKAGLK